MNCYKSELSKCAAIRRLNTNLVDLVEFRCCSDTKDPTDERCRGTRMMVNADSASSDSFYSHAASCYYCCLLYLHVIAVF